MSKYLSGYYPNIVILTVFWIYTKTFNFKIGSSFPA